MGELSGIKVIPLSYYGGNFGLFLPKFINTILSVSSLMAMAEQGQNGFLSLNKTEDQLVIAAFICFIISMIFGTQVGITNTVLWAAFGVGTFICIYFAFPYTWTYGILLFGIYAILAFGVIIIFHWGDRFLVSGLSISILAGAFLFIAAILMSFHIIQSIMKIRDAQVSKDNYLALGFWTIGVMAFAFLSFFSILGWSLYAMHGGGWIWIYYILEPIIAFLLLYILWIPDRGINWTQKELPQSPATQFIAQKTQVMKEKVIRTKNICPECGMILRMEKKSCPSCGNTQKFGWCVRSEAYALPCANCGNLALLGKETCDECQKILQTEITCNNCNKKSPVKEWVAVT